MRRAGREGKQKRELLRYAHFFNSSSLQALIKNCVLVGIGYSEGWIILLFLIIHTKFSTCFHLDLKRCFYAYHCGQ